MTRKITLAMALALLTFVYAKAQTTLTLQPDAEAGKDALLHQLFSEVDRNYGNNAQLLGAAWTFSGRAGIIRSVIDFDLSSIPEGATIVSAELSLYAWDSNVGMGRHSKIGGSNTCWLRRVTSPWDEASVTWNTRPSTTRLNKVRLKQSNNSRVDYLDIDVSNIVQDMVNDPDNSFGFMLKMSKESYYRLLNFCSSDHEDSEKRPKLVVSYITESAPDTTAEEDLSVSLFPNPSSDFITLDVPEEQKKPIYYVISGKNKVTDKGQVLPNKTIDVSDYARGMYYVKVYSEDYVFTKKLIIK